VSQLVRFCSVCVTARTFEAVPCADGHGGDCPELVCIECGYVAVVGFIDEPARRDPALDRSVA
jgi:hypothetical protein